MADNALWAKRIGLTLGCAVCFLGAAQVADRLSAKPATPAAPAVAAAPAAAPAIKPAAVPVAAPAQDMSAYRVKSVLEVKRPFTHGDWYWDESTAPASGAHGLARRWAALRLAG